MAIGRLSFLDLSPEKRAQAAAAARAKLQNLLDNPFLTAAQAKVLQEKMTQIAHWEQGMVYTPPVEEPAAELTAEDLVEIDPEEGNHV